MSQNGGWMDIEERCQWRMGRKVQRVMSWVRGIDVMRLQRYAEGIRATGRRWRRSQARTGSLDSIRKSDRAWQ